MQIIMTNISFSTIKPKVDLNSPNMKKYSYGLFPIILELFDGKVTVKAITISPQFSPQNSPFVHICAFAFYGCYLLNGILIPRTTEIGEAAFAECISLVKIEAPKTKSIGSFAFYGCISLESVCSLN